MTVRSGACSHPAENEGPALALPLKGFGDSNMPGALIGGTAAGPTRDCISLHVSERSARVRGRSRGGPTESRSGFSFQFYGPRIGALYVRGLGTLTPLHPMLFGGGQERNFRPG